MKKHVMELARTENSWAGYQWEPWVFGKALINIDDKVMEWANANNAFVYKHELRSGEYPYDPPRYEKHPREDLVMTLCVHTKELVIYYYEPGELPPFYHELLEFKRKLDEWEKQ